MKKWIASRSASNKTMELLQIVLIITLSTNAIILVLLYSMYLSQRKFADGRVFFRQIDKLKSQFAGEEERLLKDALEKSRISIREALAALKGMGELSEETKLRLEKRAEQVVQESVSRHIAIYQNVMNSITDSYKKELGGLLRLQSGEYTKILDSVKASAQEEIRKLKEDTLRIGQEERKKIEGEMTSYKEKIKADLNERIFSIISEVARETIGESIDIGKHEQLVLRTLEKAKNERLI